MNRLFRLTLSLGLVFSCCSFIANAQGKYRVIRETVVEKNLSLLSGVK